jgi:hypothetical protein
MGRANRGKNVGTTGIREGATGASGSENPAIVETLSKTNHPGTHLILGQLWRDGETPEIDYGELRQSLADHYMRDFSDKRISSQTDEAVHRLSQSGIIHKPTTGSMAWQITPEAQAVLQDSEGAADLIQKPDADSLIDHAIEGFEAGYQRGERIFLANQDDNDNDKIFQKIAEEKGQPFTEINLAEKMSGPEIDFENLTADEWPEQKGGLPASLERLRSSVQKPGVVYVNSKSLGSDLSLGSELPDALMEKLAQELSVSPGGKKTLTITGENVTVHKDCSVVIGYNQNSDLHFELFDRFRII